MTDKCCNSIKKVLFVVADPYEYIDTTATVDGVELSFLKTGVGVSETTGLSKHLQNHRYDLIINYGAVGVIEGTNWKIGQNFNINSFKKKDDEGVVKSIDGENCKLFDFPSVPCQTADSFITNDKDILGEIVDMESFYFKNIADEHKTPFISVKTISDVMGSNNDIFKVNQSINKSTKSLFLEIIKQLKKLS